jgi:hypothetical protein
MAYEVTTVHGASTTALGGNFRYQGIEYAPNFKPEAILHVFNISARTFEDAGGKGIIGRIKLRAPGVSHGDPTDVTVVDKKTSKVVPGNPNQPYHLVTTFPHPMPLGVPNDMSGMVEAKFTDGRRFVVDMISPDNVTLTLDAPIDPAKAFSVGNDYAPRGIFFSLYDPPLKEDLEKAYRRMETYYKGLNEKAGTLDMTDKLGLQRAIESNPDHIYAANYYGKPFAFAKQAIRPVDCPNCGEQKPAGRLWHMSLAGTICVEPTQEAWKAVVMAGTRTRDQVPEELRWWKTEKSV